MHRERKHADRGALAIALCQRQKGVHLPLPSPLRGRRARLRRHPARNRRLVATHVCERVERAQDDVQALVAERIEKRLTAMRFDATPGPGTTPSSLTMYQVSDSERRM